MWYFLIQQRDVSLTQYRLLQQHAQLTEVEIFNEPYENWYVFSAEKSDYHSFMDLLDGEGIRYELTPDRPIRQELLNRMK